MKQSDEQIIVTVHRILEKLHDRQNGFNAFRDELSKLNLTKDEYYRRILSKEIEIASQYGFEKASFDEQKFRISGEDVMKKHLCVSCGQAAKAFCYVNSQLPEQERLDLKVLFSTDVEHLVDAMVGHTLPCVKLSDGKWHAVEPQIAPTKYISKEQPGFHFVCDDVFVGGEIWHELKSIKDKKRPYIITKLVSPEEHQNIYSDFGAFLDASMVHDKKTAFICSIIRFVLKNNNLRQYSDSNRRVYEFCKLLKGKKFSAVKILVFNNGNKFDCVPCIIENNEYYSINLVKNYLSLLKGGNLEQSEKLFCKPGYKFQQIVSSQEYIQEFEKRIGVLMKVGAERL
jgi:hypothetical protein